MALKDRVFASKIENKGIDYDTGIELGKEVVEELPKEEKTVGLFEAQPRDLLIYFAKRYKEVHGYEYVVDWIADFAVMKSFKSRYGTEAGPIIERLFDHHKGKWNGQVCGANIVAKNAKWVTDILYSEVQEEAKSKMSQSISSTKGLMDSDAFLTKFQS